MKYLIMCEGANEKKIIEILLEHQKLKIDIDVLLNQRYTKFRKIGEFIE